ASIFQPEFSKSGRPNAAATSARGPKVLASATTFPSIRRATTVIGAPETAEAAHPWASTLSDSVSVAGIRVTMSTLPMTFCLGSISRCGAAAGAAAAFGPEPAAVSSAGGLEDEQATGSARTMKANRKKIECRRRMNTAVVLLILTILIHLRPTTAKESRERPAPRVYSSVYRRAL